MKNPMDRQLEKQLSERAVAIGREGNVAAFGELQQLLRSSSANARRLAASAMGKLAWLGVDQAAAVAALAPLARRDPHPQTRQYAIKALKAYGVAAKDTLSDLRDMTANGFAYRYDAKFRIIGEFQIRPDFYLPELDVYIEYWGMDTPQYKMNMYKKQTLYQQEGKRLVSVYPADLSRLGALLTAKLSRYGVSVGIDARSEVSR